MESINKLQINSTIDTDESGRIIKKSLMLNIRCDEIDDCVSSFASLCAKLGGNANNFAPAEITVARLPLGGNEASTESCPKCGRRLVTRRSDRGVFLGCSGYPSCKHVSPI